MSNGTFTAVTFNVRMGVAGDGENHWEKRREFLLDVVRNMDADILGLQEPFDFQLEAIAKVLPGHTLIGVGREDGVRAGEWSALFVRESRFAVKETGNFWLSETPEVPGSKSWDAIYNTRLCTWAHLEDRESGERVMAFNSHWDHVGVMARQYSAAMIASRVTDRPTSVPAIVMGDFNCTPDSPAVQYLTGQGELEEPAARTASASPHLRDAWTEMHSGEVRPGTFHGFSGDPNGEWIDYLLVSDGIDVQDCSIDRTSREGRYPSDHFPVMARLRINH